MTDLVETSNSVLLQCASCGKTEKTEITGEKPKWLAFTADKIGWVGLLEFFVTEGISFCGDEALFCSTECLKEYCYVADSSYDDLMLKGSTYGRTLYNV